MPQLSDIFSKIYQILPNATIGGKYVIDYINGKIECVNRIDLIINVEITTDHISMFKRVFEQDLIEIERIIEFDDLRPCHLIAKLRNVNTFSIFIISLARDIKNQQFFSVNNLLISPNGKIKKRKFSLFDNDDFKDIKRKRFKTNNSLISINDCLDRRYSYIRMMEFTESILAQDSTWMIDRQIQPFFKIKAPSNNQHSNEDCAICRDNIKDLSAIQLQCNHWYHVNCIKGHLSGVGPGHEKCPICRKQII